MNFFAPFGPAAERTSQQLFRPFDIGKWFTLGFSAWLASFISNTVSFSSYSPFDHADGDTESWNFVVSLGLPAWIGIVLGVGLLIWLLIALFVWLGCRGKFIFLDNILHNRADVVAPWKSQSRAGNSLFLAFLTVITISYALCLTVIVFAMVYLWPDLVARQVHGAAHYIPLMIAGGIFLLFAMGASIYLFFLREFGALYMYRHGVSAWTATRRIASLATQAPLHFILYLLIRICVALVLISAIFALACVTCCLSLLPYIGTVITLPLYVFLAWYNLECFAQFGSEYDVRLTGEEPPLLPTSV